MNDYIDMRNRCVFCHQPAYVSTYGDTGGQWNICPACHSVLQVVFRGLAEPLDARIAALEAERDEVRQRLEDALKYKSFWDTHFPGPELPVSDSPPVGSITRAFVTWSNFEVIEEEE